MDEQMDEWIDVCGWMNRWMRLHRYRHVEGWMVVSTDLAHLTDGHGRRRRHASRHLHNASTEAKKRRVSCLTSWAVHVGKGELCCVVSYLLARAVHYGRVGCQRHLRATNAGCGVGVMSHNNLPASFFATSRTTVLHQGKVRRKYVTPWLVLAQVAARR
jgi:hypothetical protein